MTKTQLLELCKLRGVEGVNSGNVKADIISALLGKEG